MHRRLLCVVAVVIVCVGPAWGNEEDIRTQYGTRSLTAARHIAEAMKHSQKRNHTEGLRAINLALKADPECYFALFQKALFEGDLGRIPEAIESYKMCVEAARRQRDINGNVPVNAMVNLGLTLVDLKRTDEANSWFTQAILADPTDRCERHWVALRNQGINLHAQGRHLAALLSLLWARSKNPAKVSDRLVSDVARAAGNEEAACILQFPHETPKIASRPETEDLVRVDAGADVTETVLDLLPDPQGRYVLAIVSGEPHYYVLTTAKTVTVRKVALPSPVTCGVLAGGKLYVAGVTKPQLLQLDPTTGKLLKALDFQGPTPTSIAVFPYRNRAYFPVQRRVYGLDLTTGRRFSTDMPGQVVAGHPTEALLYSFVKPSARHESPFGTIFIGGRPVTYHLTPRRYSMTPTTLFQSYVAGDKLLLAGVRDNAASNGYHIVISPDGHWLSLPGGGGWRPSRGPAGSAVGYGIPVFGARNLEEFHGFFPTDAYPTGVAYNPVTGQVATTRTKDVRVYHLSDPSKHQLLDVPSNGCCAWSGDGEYLVLGRQKKRAPGRREPIDATEPTLAIYRNTLTTDEKTLARTWWRDIPSATGSAATSALQPTVKAEAHLTTFAVRQERSHVAKALTGAIKANRTKQLILWRLHVPYTTDAQALTAITDADRLLKTGERVGTAIYLLKQALTKRPKHTPTAYYLATALHKGGQLQASEPYYLQAIRSDAGRSELTTLSLDALHDVFVRTDRPLGAIYCLAEALSLDCANPRILGHILPLLTKNGFKTEAKALSAKGSSGGASPVPPITGRTLPKLPYRKSNMKKRPPTEIYRTTVPSVVLIKVGKGTGTGFCIGEPGIIVTNAHVLESGQQYELYAYEYTKDRVRKLARTSGSILYRNAERDIAVIKMDMPPASMKPLPVASSNPKAGQKVYAIGNPGLGSDVLEQSITEGIVSSASRTIKGQKYVQHTAAVNPGNSGGPLINVYGEVVGLITLKTDLENVGFAVGAKEIRQVFTKK
jgi:tetratricopeptide (TPR) repeat protein